MAFPELNGRSVLIVASEFEVGPIRDTCQDQAQMLTTTEVAVPLPLLHYMNVYAIEGAILHNVQKTMEEDIIEASRAGKRILITKTSSGSPELEDMYKRMEAEGVGIESRHAETETLLEMLSTLFLQ